MSEILAVAFLFSIFATGAYLVLRFLSHLVTYLWFTDEETEDESDGVHGVMPDYSIMGEGGLGPEGTKWADEWIAAHKYV